MLRNTYKSNERILLLRKMATQLNLTENVTTGAMSALALDFKLHFEKSSPILNERLTGRRFVFNKDGKEYYPFGEWEEGAGGILEGITPLECEAIVASTDSSCILIGETSDGSA